MIHLNYRQEAQISGWFGALVLYQTVVLLLLTHFCEGQSQVIDEPQPLVAMAGDDVILPCHLEPAVDAASMTVEWARADLNPRFVHVRRDGVELLIDQNPSYIGRTSMSIKKLECGDLSLELSKVKLSDEGTYKCLIPTQRSTSVVKLAVGSVSSPILRLSKLIGEGSGLFLDCQSKGWYPEPEVFWLDGEGNLLSAGPTETVRGPDGLYTVSSRVTVEKRHSNSFTCRVQQKNINQTRETHIHVPDDLFVVRPCSVGRISIVLVVAFIWILAVVLGAFLMRRTEIKTKRFHDKLEEGKKTASNKTERQSPVGSAGETSQLLKVHVDREKEKLDEELEKNEGELKEVRGVLDILGKHKTDLKTHKEQVSLMLKEMIDKNVTKDKNPKTKLERRKGMQKTILSEAEKLIEATEAMFVKMTVINVRLEKDKEQVNKQLRVRQKDESQTEQLDNEELK